MLPLELLYEQYKQISKTCKEVFIDKFYVHMPKIVEEQKKKSDKSAFADMAYCCDCWYAIYWTYPLFLAWEGGFLTWICFVSQT